MIHVFLLETLKKLSESNYAWFWIRKLVNAKGNSYIGSLKHYSRKLDFKFRVLFYRSQDRGRRKGYMGHLTKMANDIVAVMEKGENADLVKDQFAGMFVEVCFRRWLTTWRKLLQTNFICLYGFICPNSRRFMISVGGGYVISVTFIKCV